MRSLISKVGPTHPLICLGEVGKIWNGKPPASHELISASKMCGVAEPLENELVARGNAFVAFQKLETERNRVLPALAPDHFEPISVVDFDWNSTSLSFTLNRSPELDFIKRLHQAMDP